MPDGFSELGVEGADLAGSYSAASTHSLISGNLMICSQQVAQIVSSAPPQGGNASRPAHTSRQPRSLLLTAGPIDIRITPTRINVLAPSRLFRWFGRSLIKSLSTQLNTVLLHYWQLYY